MNTWRGMRSALLALCEENVELSAVMVPLSINWSYCWKYSRVADDLRLRDSYVTSLPRGIDLYCHASCAYVGDNASKLILQSNVWFDISFRCTQEQKREHKADWKPWFVVVPTLSLLSPKVVIKSVFGDASDDKVDLMKTRCLCEVKSPGRLIFYH